MWYRAGVTFDEKLGASEIRRRISERRMSQRLTASGKVLDGSKRRLILTCLRKSRDASGPRAGEVKERQTEEEMREVREKHVTYMVALWLLH